MNFPDRATTLGQSIDQYLKNKNNLNDNVIHLLFSANRWEKQYARIFVASHCRKEIETLLSQGKTIICGRYAYSGVAYSGAKGMDMNWCMDPDRGLWRPDLVIYLNIAVEEAAKRAGYGAERYEKIQFQTMVNQMFAKLLIEDNVVSVDAVQGIDAIHAQIAKLALQKVHACQQGTTPMQKLWPNY